MEVMKVADRKIAMIILAAGESKRLGTIKQNLPWKKTTLLGHAIEQGISSIADVVIVVLGSNAETILNGIDQTKITIINNSNWQEGMGTSIACAMHYLHKNSLYFDAVLIALADQPLIKETHFNNLIYSFFNNDKNIICTQINRKAGVPAIFASKYFSALSELDKDYGARKILRNNQNDILTLNIGDEIIDIDTLETYKYLHKRYGKINMQ